MSSRARSRPPGRTGPRAATLPSPCMAACVASTAARSRISATTIRSRSWFRRSSRTGRRTLPRGELTRPCASASRPGKRWWRPRPRRSRRQLSEWTWPDLKAPRIQGRAGGRRRAGRMPEPRLPSPTCPRSTPGPGWNSSPASGRRRARRCSASRRCGCGALPVDSHHHRVAKRLGLIGPRVGLGPAHVILLAQLPAEWTAQQLYDNHEILMLHGQRVCQPLRPACGRCALVDLCPSAVREMREP